jgi:hypothetical protein
METTHQEQAQSSHFIPWIPTKDEKDDQNRFIDDPRFTIAIALKNKRK